MNNKTIINNDKKLYTLEEICYYLSLSKSQVRKYIYAGMIPHYKFGNRYRFDAIEIDEWMKENYRQEINNDLYSIITKRNVRKGA